MSTYLKILVILAIGLATIIFILYKNPVRNLQQKGYRVESNHYSLVFSTNKPEEIFKISPLDDYYYQANLKDHLMKDSNFRQKRNLFTELMLTVEGLFSKQKHLAWSLQKDQVEINYEVEDLGNQVRISRILKGFSPKIFAIGQTITFCKDCLLTDENKQVFLMENLLTKEKLNQIAKLKLIPIIISNEQLPKVSKLVALNPSGEKRLEVSVAENQQAFYFENWNVLELKTPVWAKNVISASQIISLNL